MIERIAVIFILGCILGYVCLGERMIYGLLTWLGAVIGSIVISMLCELYKKLKHRGMK